MHRLKPPLFGLFDGWWGRRSQGGENEFRDRGVIPCLGYRINVLIDIDGGGVEKQVQEHEMKKRNEKMETKMRWS